jgi:hypothetical protein
LTKSCAPAESFTFSVYSCTPGSLTTNVWFQQTGRALPQARGRAVYGVSSGGTAAHAHGRVATAHARPRRGGYESPQLPRSRAQEAGKVLEHLVLMHTVTNSMSPPRIPPPALCTSPPHSAFRTPHSALRLLQVRSRD